MAAQNKSGLFTATKCTTMEGSAMDTAFKHVCNRLRGYVQHQHRGSCFLIMGALK